MCLLVFILQHGSDISDDEVVPPIVFPVCVDMQYDLRSISLTDLATISPSLTGGLTHSYTSTLESGWGGEQEKSFVTLCYKMMVSLCKTKDGKPVTRQQLFDGLALTLLPFRIENEIP